MPQYEFLCPACGKEETRLLSIVRMDAPQTCTCGEVLERVEIPRNQHTTADAVYRMQVILSNGQKIDAPGARQRRGLNRNGKRG